MKKMEELKARIEESRRINKRLIVSPTLKKLIKDVYKDYDMGKTLFCKEIGINQQTVNRIVGVSKKRKVKKEKSEQLKTKPESKDYLIHNGNLYVKFPKNITKAIALEFMKSLG